MNFKTPLELDIYWKEESVCQLEELGINLAEQSDYVPQTKPVTFYSVDYVSSSNIVGLKEEVGFISSGGEEFATSMDYIQLKYVFTFEILRNTNKVNN